MTSDTAVTWCEEPTLLPHRSTERRAGSQTVWSGEGDYVRPRTILRSAEPVSRRSPSITDVPGGDGKLHQHSVIYP
ncbi:unnamed protein product [Knipowitschia caucasica]